jgi:probable phosphoglycerate mutase
VCLVITLHLVRHGATRYSLEKRYLGWRQFGLTSEGENQARALKDKLRGYAFSSVWTSDLRRSVQTAQAAGFPKAKRTPKLREFDFGRVEGLTWGELSVEDQEAILNWASSFCPGRESLDDFRSRILRFCSGLADGEHLIFCHGGVVLVLQKALDLPITPIEPAKVLTIRFPRWRF